MYAKQEENPLSTPRVNIKFATRMQYQQVDEHYEEVHVRRLTNGNEYCTAAYDN